MRQALIATVVALLLLAPSGASATVYGESTDNSNTTSTSGGYPQRATSGLGTPSTTQTVGDAWLILDVAGCTAPCDFFTSPGGDSGWRVSSTALAYQEWLWSDGAGHYSGWLFNGQTGKLSIKFTGHKWNTNTNYTLGWGTYDASGDPVLKSNAANTALWYQMSDTNVWEDTSVVAASRKIRGDGITR